MEEEIIPVTFEGILRKVTRLQNLPSKFEEACSDHQYLVLKYIEDNRINLHFFSDRGYDALNRVFFALEYCVSEDGKGVSTKRREWPLFEDYFGFLSGDIYKRSCYWGYSFSKEESSRFHLRVGLMNFVAFTRETASDYSVEIIETSKADNFAKDEERRDAMILYLQRSVSASTLNELELCRKRFEKRFNVCLCRGILHTYLLTAKKEEFENAAIDSFGMEYGVGGVSFGQILTTYGADVARKALKHSLIYYSPSTSHKNRVGRMKRDIIGFENGELKRNRIIRYQSFDTGLYNVTDYYFRGNSQSFKVENYFLDVGSLLKFVGDDISGADLSKAPIRKEELLGCTWDEQTKWPESRSIVRQETKKAYTDGRFVFLKKFFAENDRLVHSVEKTFRYACDFVYFLEGDLTNGDYYECENIVNLFDMPGVDLSGAVLSSSAMKRRGIDFERVKLPSFSAIADKNVEKNELATLENYIAMRQLDAAPTPAIRNIGYISDIHVLHRIVLAKCQSESDVEHEIKVIAKRLGETAEHINLIAGDVSSDPHYYDTFLSALSAEMKNKTVFFTLGNHELWPYQNTDLATIVEIYKSKLREYGFYLVHNNLFVLNDSGWEEISEGEIDLLSEPELLEKTRYARLCIFGGMGFAGKNHEFNADKGDIYRSVVTREQEMRESERFDRAYFKVASALRDKNVVIVTHMPKEDWHDSSDYVDGFVYVSGHNHRNRFYDDGAFREYADNQVGYRQNVVRFRPFDISFEYDVFDGYQDGIYPISATEYESFFRGKNEYVEFNRPLELFMIKRNGYYCFISRSKNGSLSILNGGQLNRLPKKELQYFYENMQRVVDVIEAPLNKYTDVQKRIAAEVLALGGYGTIHGSIVDIDFRNHIYVNPIDLTVVGYHATDMIDKTVYPTIPALLEERRPDLYRALTQKGGGGELTSLPLVKLEGIEEPTFYPSTDIYKASRIIKKMQKLHSKVLSVWIEDDTANGLAAISELNPSLTTRE